MSASLDDANQLLIVRTFEAPAELVFSLWAEPEHFSRWMGPHGFECPSAEIDFREGGAYRAVIRSPEHGDSWFGGTYREIDPPRRLVFTFAWDGGPSGGLETLITLTFEARGGKTVQTFHQTPFLNPERRDRQAFGWGQSFERAQAYAERIARETIR